VKEKEPAMDKRDDGLDAARGIIHGVRISLWMWLAIALLALATCGG